MLPLVRPILKIDVQLLENEFINEYREGDCVLYVFIVNNCGKSLFVSEDKLKSWDPIWEQINNIFEQSFFPLDVEAPNGSNIHKVSTFENNKSISNM